jgi:ABC-type branched-subunit amino acid transport system substrate-binding protein
MGMLYLRLLTAKKMNGILIKTFVVLMALPLWGVAQKDPVRIKRNEDVPVTGQQKTYNIAEGKTKAPRTETPEEGGIKEYTISLVLPFRAEGTIAKLENLINPKEANAWRNYQLSEDVVMALDFYQGAMLALKSSDSVSFHLQVFDTHANDSVLQEILKDRTLERSDVIIGSIATTEARLVAEYCKRRKIINLQPFSPSKSLTSNNPYHIKLAPTIDAHLDVMYSSIMDSFRNDNVIVYSGSKERDSTAAIHLDTLLRKAKGIYKGLSYTLVKSTAPKGKDMLSNLSDTKRNAIVICSYDEPIIQSLTKSLATSNKRNVVYGFPTWLNSEIIRLDYLNALSLRITNWYATDSSSMQYHDFVTRYTGKFETVPTEYASLGYDVMDYAQSMLTNNGRKFLNKDGNPAYYGTGHSFRLREVVQYSPTIKLAMTQYYENEDCHLFYIDNYALHKER